MRQLISPTIVVCVIAAAALTGCLPSQPHYMFENGDMSYYLDQATQSEHPDVEQPRLAEVENAQAPFTLTDPFESGNFWNLSLEEVVAIALHNSKVIRSLQSINSSIDGRSSQPDALIGNPEPESSTTVYDSALVESNPFSGVEGALAEFDAQLTSSLFWDTTDRPQNVVPNPVLNPFLVRDVVVHNLEIGKKTAGGTELFFRNVTEYDRSNNPFQPPGINSFYTTALEVEARHPLLRGRGTQVNRIPIIIARIQNDISIADFEANVRNLALDVEKTYWDLACRYRILESNKTARDRSLEAWRDKEPNPDPVEDELRAKAQYHSFQAQVQNSLRELYNTESHLRWLLGLAATDGRLIRPTDKPTSSKVVFDWFDIHCEALIRSAELRREKWVIKQREMELIAARNQLLPDLNVTALYRWLGVGDNLTSASRNGLNFPTVGSTAWEGLTEGRSQELRLGFEFAMPVGFRRELAGVRNAQLGLARERSRLKDMELNVSHLLSQAVRDMDGLLNEAETYFNQFAATTSEIEALKIRESGGQGRQVDYLLRAYQRAVGAEILYHQAVCNYNKAIAQVHFRKGSLLEYNNIHLAEGPWPQKAYWDAKGHARRRAASHYLNYGWSRPRVISQGEVPQHTGTSPGGLMPRLEGVPTPAPNPTPTPVIPQQDVLPMPVPTSAQAMPRGAVAPVVNINSTLRPFVHPTHLPQLMPTPSKRQDLENVVQVLTTPDANSNQSVSFQQPIQPTSVQAAPVETRQITDQPILNPLR